MTASVPSAGYPILIVDDEPLLRDILAEALSDYSVHTASDGRTALALMEEQSFDLVITDLMMPDVSGFDVLRTAQALERSVDVVVVTGYLSVEYENKCRQLGCRAILSKPFDVTEVRDEVRRCLEDKLRDQPVE